MPTTVSVSIDKFHKLESDLADAREQVAEMREAIEEIRNCLPRREYAWQHIRYPHARMRRIAEIADRVLSAAPAGGRVIARWIGQVKGKGGPVLPDIHFDDRDNSLAIYLPEDCDAFVGQVLSLKLEEYTDEKAT